MAYHGQQAYSQGLTEPHHGPMSAMDPNAAASAGAYAAAQGHPHPMTAMGSTAPMAGTVYAPQPGQAMYPGLVAADGYSQGVVDPTSGAYWQLPPAPRLPTAAARGWVGIVGYQYPQSSLAAYQAYGQGGAWAPSSQQQQQQHHHQLALAAQHAEAEQALLHQQQMAAHFARGQQAALAPTSQPMQMSQSQTAMSTSGQAYYPSAHAHAPAAGVGYPSDSLLGASQRLASAPFAQPGHQLDVRHHDQHHALGPAAQIRSRSAHDYGRDSADPTRTRRLPSLHELEWRSHQQHRHGRLSDSHSSAGWAPQYPQANAHPADRDAAAARPVGHHSYDQTWQQQQQQRAMHQQQRSDRQSEWRRQSLSAAGRSEGSQRQAPPPQQQQQVEQPTAQPAPAAPEEGANKGPAPPSPGTLDKSGVPISAFGAELIWYACATLLEPELVQEAHLEQTISTHTRSPSSGSVASSPLLSTPATSPHSPHLLAKDSDMPSFAAFASGHFDEKLFAVKRGEQKRSRTSDERSTGSSSRESSGPGTPSPDAEVNRHHSAAAHLLALQDHQPSLRDGSPMRLSSPPSTANGPAKRGPLFMRTKSQERSKAAVLSVLALVSPYWKWTRAAEALPSLVQTAAATSENVRKAKQGEHGHQTSPREHSTSSAAAFAAGGEVSPAFRRFAHQVLAQTLLSPTAFLLGLLFALRVPYLAVDASGTVDPEAVELLASPPSAAPFKLLTLGLMMANKHLDDNTFLNKTWSEVTGIPLPELNKLEQYYLIRCNYEIAIPHSVWCSFLKRVKRREEDKQAAFKLADAQRYREHSPRATSTPSQRETSTRVLLALDDMLSALGSRVIEHLDLEGEERRAEQKKRPTSGLLLQHQHCQSAPASASLFKDEIHRQDSRPSLDSRSWSDAATAIAADHKAPLAPSALLELLNSGRSLASAH